VTENERLGFYLALFVVIFALPFVALLLPRRWWRKLDRLGSSDDKGQAVRFRKKPDPEIDLRKPQ